MALIRVENCPQRYSEYREETARPRDMLRAIYGAVSRVDHKGFTSDLVIVQGSEQLFDEQRVLYVIVDGYPGGPIEYKGRITAMIRSAAKCWLRSDWKVTVVITDAMKFRDS